jgi:hypothetical protein
MPDALLAEKPADLKIHDAFEGPAGTAPFEGVIGVEGLLTGDGRLIAEDSLEWAAFPLPLRYAPADFGGHDGAVIVGRIDKVERLENNDIFAWGVIDLGSDDGRECARLMRGQFLSGVSMDLDSVDSFDASVKMELGDGTTATADNVLVTREARVRAATLVAIPAFDEARLSLIASMGTGFRQVVGHGAFSLVFENEETEFEAFRAGYARETERNAKRASLIASISGAGLDPRARQLAELAEKRSAFGPVVVRTVHSARKIHALATKTQALTGKTDVYGFNPLELRNPTNGEWLPSPFKIMDDLLAKIDDGNYDPNGKGRLKTDPKETPEFNDAITKALAESQKLGPKDGLATPDEVADFTSKALLDAQKSIDPKDPDAAYLNTNLNTALDGLNKITSENWTGWTASDPADTSDDPSLDTSIAGASFDDPAGSKTVTGDPTGGVNSEGVTVDSANSGALGTDQRDAALKADGQLDDVNSLISSGQAEWKADEQGNWTLMAVPDNGSPMLEVSPTGEVMPSNADVSAALGKSPASSGNLPGGTELHNTGMDAESQNVTYKVDAESNLTATDGDHSVEYGQMVPDPTAPAALQEAGLDPNQFQDGEIWEGEGPQGLVAYVKSGDTWYSDANNVRNKGIQAQDATGGPIETDDSGAPPQVDKARGEGKGTFFNGPLGDSTSIGGTDFEQDATTGKWFDAQGEVTNADDLAALKGHADSKPTTDAAPAAEKVDPKDFPRGVVSDLRAGDQVLVHGEPKTIASITAGPSGSDGPKNELTFDDGTKMNIELPLEIPTRKAADVPTGVVDPLTSDPAALKAAGIDNSGQGTHPAVANTLDNTVPGTDENGIPFTDLGKAHAALHAAAIENGSSSPAADATKALETYKQKRAAGLSHADAGKETAKEAYPPKPKTDSKGMIITTPKAITEAAVANPDAYTKATTDGQHIMGGLPDSWAIDSSHADSSGAMPSGQGYYILRPVRGSGARASMGDYGHFSTPEEAMAAQKGYEDGNAAYTELSDQIRSGKANGDAINAAWPEPLWTNITKAMLAGEKPKAAVTAAVTNLQPGAGDGSGDSAFKDLSDADLLKQLRGMLMNGGKAADVAALEAEAKSRGLKVMNSGLNGLSGETEVLAGSESFREGAKPVAAVDDSGCDCDELAEQGVQTFGFEDSEHWRNPADGEFVDMPGFALTGLLKTLADGGVAVRPSSAEAATGYADQLDTAIKAGDWDSVFKLSPQFYDATGALYEDYLEAAGTPAYEDASNAYQALETSVGAASEAADQAYVGNPVEDSGAVTGNDPAEVAMDSGFADANFSADASGDSGEGLPEDISSIAVNPVDTGDDMLDEAILDAVDAGQTVVIITPTDSDEPVAPDSDLDDAIGDPGEDLLEDAVADSGEPEIGDSGAETDSGDSGAASLPECPEAELLSALVTMIGGGTGEVTTDDIEAFEALAGEVIAAAYGDDFQTVAQAAPVLLSELDVLTQAYAAVSDVSSQIDQFRASILALIANGPDEMGVGDSGEDEAPAAADSGDDGWAAKAAEAFDEVGKIAFNARVLKYGYASAAEEFKAKKHGNWVEQTGGLPHYIKRIAKHLQERGMDQSHAIAAAVSTVKRWSRGGNGVKADTVAKSLAALAEWEAKKAASHVNAAEGLTFANGPGLHKDGTPPVCKFCANTSTGYVLWAEGMAFVPFCDEHKQAAQDAIDDPGDIVSVSEYLPAGEDTSSDEEVAEALATLIQDTARPTELSSLIASAGQTMLAPLAPPKEWFANPHLTGVTPLTVTKEGRIYGHLATWQACHMESNNLGSTCVRAPKSRDGYSAFHLGYVTTEDGTDVPTGRIIAGAPHADPVWGMNSTMVHYSHSGYVGADVRVGEDKFGIWFSGALRPDISPNQLRALKASPLSGDWRVDPGTGRLELVASLAVNAPGYKVPRPQALIASMGSVSSMQAVGLVPPKTIALRDGKPLLEHDDLVYLKQRAAETKSWAATADSLMTLARQVATDRVRSFDTERKMSAFASRVQEIR